MTKILFSTMKFRPGLNITVRLGDKWNDFRGPIDIARTERSDVAHTGIVVDTLYFERFEELYESVLLRLEHDPYCKNFFNLIKTMNTMYPGNHVTGELPFSRESAVTVVFFTIDAEVEDEVQVEVVETPRRRKRKDSE